jgi:hypothetical protein
MGAMKFRGRRCLLWLPAEWESARGTRTEQAARMEWAMLCCRSVEKAQKNHLNRQE